MCIRDSRVGDLGKSFSRILQGGLYPPFAASVLLHAAEIFCFFTPQKKGNEMKAGVGKGLLHQAEYLPASAVKAVCKENGIHQRAVQVAEEHGADIAGYGGDGIVVEHKGIHHPAGVGIHIGGAGETCLLYTSLLQDSL